jgi:hypothetical protein
MLAYKIQMPGNYPEETIQHSEQGKSLKPNITFTSERVYANARWKTPIEINFIHSGDKEMRFLDMLHNLCFIFHQIPFISQVHLFCPNMFCIRHALKFKYPLQQDKG